MRKRTVIYFVLGGAAVNLALYVLNWVLWPSIKGGPLEKLMQKVQCPIFAELPRRVFDGFADMGLVYPEDPIAFLLLFLIYLAGTGAVYGLMACGISALYKKYRKMKGSGQAKESLAR